MLAGRCYERELRPLRRPSTASSTRSSARSASCEDAFVASLLPPRAAILLHAFPVLGRVDALARAHVLPEGMDAREVRASMFAALRELLRRLAEESGPSSLPSTICSGRTPTRSRCSPSSCAARAHRASCSWGRCARRRRRPPATSALLRRGRARSEAITLGNLEGASARALALDLLSATAPGRAGDLAEVVARESAGHPLFPARSSSPPHSDAPAHERRRAAHARRRAARAPRRVLAARAAGAAGARARGARPRPCARSSRRRGRVDGRPPCSPSCAPRASSTRLRAASTTWSTSRARSRAAGRARASLAPEGGARAARAPRGHARSSASTRCAPRVTGARRGSPRAPRSGFAEAAARAAEGVRLRSRRRALRVGARGSARARGRTSAAASSRWGWPTRSPTRAEARPRRGATSRRPGGAGRERPPLALRRRATDEELIRSGRLDEGRAVAAEALADAGLRFARAPLRALLGQRALLRLRGHRFRRRSVEEIAPRDLARVDLCWSLSSGLGLMDPVQGAHFQVRSLLLALRAGEPYRVARGIAGEAAYAAAQGQAGRSLALLDEAGRIAGDLGSAHATGIVSLMSGLSSHLLGRFREGIEHLDAASRVFREQCVGTVWELNAARQFSLECLYYLGELPRFRAEASEALREAVDRGSVYATTTMRTGIANTAWLLDDDPARAREEVAAAKGLVFARLPHPALVHALRRDPAGALRGRRRRCARAHGGGMVGPAALAPAHDRAHAPGRAPLARARRPRGRGPRRRARGARPPRGRAQRMGPDVRGPRRGRRGGAGGRARARGRRVRARRGRRARHGLALFAAAADLAVAELAGDAASADAALGWMSARGAKDPRAIARMLIPA